MACYIITFKFKNIKKKHILSLILHGSLISLFKERKNEKIKRYGVWLMFHMYLSLLYLTLLW